MPASLANQQAPGLRETSPPQNQVEKQLSQQHASTQPASPGSPSIPSAEPLAGCGPPTPSPASLPVADAHAAPFSTAFKLSCSFPRRPDAGDVTVMDLHSGGEAQFHCHLGYELQGAKTLTCINASKPHWSSQEPVCSGTASRAGLSSGAGRGGAASSVVVVRLHAMLTPNHKLIPLLVQNCGFAAVMNCHVNI